MKFYKKNYTICKNILLLLKFKQKKLTLQMKINNRDYPKQKKTIIGICMDGTSYVARLCKE